MDINVLIIAAILVVSICSFGYLLAIMLTDWKASGKGDLFSEFESGAHDRHERGPGCFHTCMKKFAWDVDEVPLCASKCKA